MTNAFQSKPVSKALKTAKTVSVVQPTATAGGIVSNADINVGSDIFGATMLGVGIHLGMIQ